ncbi:MAG: type II toxin-antitoxin system VapC family toxin [Planctomycetaceae bacterium]
MIAIDTNILIWGVRKAPDPARPDYVERAAELIKDQHDMKQPILIPSVVLSEYLVGQEESRHAQVIAALGKSFYIAPYDTKAAMIAAKLFNRKTYGDIKAGHAVQGQCLKADYKVLATAIAHGATALYVDDGWFKKIVQSHIAIRDLPPLRKHVIESTVSATPAGAPRREEQIGLGFEDEPSS